MSPRSTSRQTEFACTCCRVIQHDLTGHKLEPVKSSIERVGNITIQPDPSGHKLEPGGSFRLPGWPAVRLLFIGDLPGSDLWSGGSCYLARQQVEVAQRPAASGNGTADRLRSIGDLPGSDLWSGRSCNIARQQVEVAQRPAAGGSRHCLPRARSICDLPNSNLWFGKSCGIARQQVEVAQRPAASGSGHCPPGLT